MTTTMTTPTRHDADDRSHRDDQRPVGGTNQGQPGQRQGQETTTTVRRDNNRGGRQRQRGGTTTTTTTRDDDEWGTNKGRRVQGHRRGGSKTETHEMTNYADRDHRNDEDDHHHSAPNCRRDQLLVGWKQGATRTGTTRWARTAPHPPHVLRRGGIFFFQF